MTTASELITGVDFVSVPTHDLAASVEFYGTTLGLPIEVHMPERNFAEFDAGNLTLGVMDAEKMGMEHHVSHTVIALHVADVAATRAELEERGVVFSMDNFDTGVCHMAFFTDPDGNALMLHNRYAPRTAKT